MAIYAISIPQVDWIFVLSRAALFSPTAHYYLFVLWYAWRGWDTTVLGTVHTHNKN